MATEICYCGECQWHRKEYDDWVCTNPDSEYCGEPTEYEDGCFEYEKR